MTPEEEDLKTLERSTRLLRVEWEKFFSGLERFPPHHHMRRTEKIIRRYAGGEIQNSGRRFLYQSLTARFNTYKDMWNKRLRAMEEGRPAGFHGTKAAKAPPASPRARPQAGSRGEFRIQNKLGDAETVQQLFEQFVEARKDLGEPANVKFESFQKLIAQQTDRILSQKEAVSVAFRLDTKGGRVSLKARPVRD